MLTNNLPIQHDKLEVIPRPVELLFADDGVAPLTLILDPLEDLAEMHAHRKMNFSLKEYAAVEWDKMAGIFAEEMQVLQHKEDRFHNAPTFINRLANLAELAGDRSREENFLLRIRELVDDEFVEHRLGENLLARGKIDDAEKLFTGLNLQQDSYANLRLAFLQVKRKDLDAALLFVDRAVSIDPLDFGVRLFEGSLHLVRGEYDLAIQSFRFAAEERQTSCVLFTNLALAYIYIGKSEKAFAALRKAVALDPSNENAIALLSDWAFIKGRDEDAVPSLRCFLQFEQKNSAMWSRLARALLEMGEANEAIATLKRQGSIENTSAVWNNLGVAYHRQHVKKKAYEAFKYAMKLEGDHNSRDVYLAARNIAALLVEDHAYKDTLSFTKAFFAEDIKRMMLSDPQLGDVYIFHVIALLHTGFMKEAARISEQLLTVPNAAPNVVAWLAASLISYYSLEDETCAMALNLVRSHEGLLTTLQPQYIQIKNILTNNIAFAYLEAGDIDTAKQYLQQLSNVVHKEPYPTATLGLFHMRKGNIDRAEHLYEEAIHLAKMPEDKKRIRQKLNFELGVQYFDTDPSRARRYLQKVAEQGDSVPQIANRARILLNRLPTKGSGATTISHMTKDLLSTASTKPIKFDSAALRSYERDITDTVINRANIEVELVKALEEHQLKFYYQVQMGGSGQPFCLEALIYWLHPDRGLMHPAEFMPMAEETKLILPIGQWALDTACAQINAWQQDALTRNLVLQLPISTKQFHRDDFVFQVQAAIQRHSINSKLLMLEFTESMLMENIEGTIGTLNQLKSIGVQISLDDFGTGYSSTLYLKQLPLDQIKIDMSSYRNNEALQAIISMSNSLKFNVVVAGLETEEQRRFLLNSGCVNYKGYLFGKPMPIEQFDLLLK